jgi:hypothetical protein
MSSVLLLFVAIETLRGCNSSVEMFQGPAATAVNNGIQVFMDDVKRFMATVRSVPDKLTDGTMNMATTFRDKIDEYRGAMMGGSSTDPDMTVIVHLDEIKKVYKSHPKQYQLLLQLAKKGSIAPRADVDQLLLTMSSMTDKAS